MLRSQYEQIFRALERLDGKYVAFHLMLQCCGYCQLQFLAGTAPRTFLAPLFDWYEDRFKQAVEVLVGQTLSEQALRQVGFLPDRGRLGLVAEKIAVGQEFCSRADVSYIVAICSTRYLCEALISHPGDLASRRPIYLGVAIQRLESLFPPPPSLPAPAPLLEPYQKP